MKLSDIVPLLKEGDRFQSDSQERIYPKAYFFMKDEYVHIHHENGMEEEASLNYRGQLTANYEFLPPEPKFKVGDRVAHIRSEQEIGVIDKAEYSQVEKSWGYRVPSCGWYSEDHIALYIPKPKFKVGDVVGVVRAKWMDDNGIIGTIQKTIYGSANNGDNHYYEVKDREGRGCFVNDSEIELYTPDTCSEKLYNPFCDKCYGNGTGLINLGRCDFSLPAKGYCAHCGQEVKEWKTKPFREELIEPPVEWDGGDLPKWKAFYLTWKMWDWLAKHPGKGKRHWPGWKCNGGQVSRVRNDCFACRYKHCLDSDGETNTYSKCILWGLWPKGCEDSKSSYRKWLSDGSEHAQTIADFARDRYYEECGREKK